MTSNLDRQRESFRADPADDRSFAALEAHHFGAGEWAQLLALYEHRLRAPTLGKRPALQAPILVRLAQVHERLGDPERALVAYRRALAARPDERHALEGATRVLVALGRAAEAAELWEGAIARAPAADRAEPLVALARLHGGALGDAGRAAELYRRALASDPACESALVALTEDAVRRSDWRELAELQRRRFEIARDPAVRFEIALEAGHLEWEQLRSPDAARAWLCRAQQLRPDDARALEALADLERTRGDDDALLACLERIVETSGERPPVWALLEAAALHTDAGRDESALALLERAAQLAPADAFVAEALSDALAALGRHEELSVVLEQRARMPGTDAATRGSVLAELGGVLEQHLGDPIAARDAYARARDADPGAPGVAAALERLGAKRAVEDEDPDGAPGATLPGVRSAAGSAPPAVTIYEADPGPDAVRRPRAGAGPPEPSRSPTREPTAPARAHEPRAAPEPAAGARAPEPAPDDEPDELEVDDETLLEARVREAEVCADRSRMALLAAEIERLSDALGRPEEALRWVERWVSLAPESADALRASVRLHERLGHGEEVIAALEALDELLPHAERGAHRRRLAALYAGRGDVARAIRACEAALEIDAADVEALRQLDRHLDSTERFEELAHVRARRAELVAPPERTQCLDALAALQSERLGDPAAAIDTLVALLREPATPAGTGERLEELLRATGRREELAAHLEAHVAALGPDAPERGAVVLRLAHALRSIERYDDAAAAYREALARDPDCAEAREGLEEALRAGIDAEGLAEFLALQAEASPDPAARDRALLERAVLLEELLHRTPEARDAYTGLVRRGEEPSLRADAARRLEALLERMGEWEALRLHLEGLLGTGPREADAIRRRRLVALCRDRIFDEAGAIRHLEALAHEHRDEVELWHELARLYESEGRQEDAVRALRVELEADLDPERELAVHRRLAELLGGPLADPGRAAPHHERAFELDPRDPRAAEFLTERFEREDRPNELLQVLETRLAALASGAGAEEPAAAAQRTVLRVRAAGVRETRLDDLEGAISALEVALGEVGPAPVVAEPLADLYQRAGYANDLIDLCGRAAAACSDGGERASWLVRRGDALYRTGQAREAAEAYRTALTERPDDLDAEAALRGLWRELGECESLARLLEAQLSRLSGPDEIPVRLELAELLAGPLERPADAVPHLRRVLDVDPAHGLALDRAIELAESGDRPESLLELVDAALGRPQPASARAALLARRGRVLAERLERPADAAASLRESLALDPGRGDVRRALAELLETLGRWSELVGCLGELSRRAPSEPERIALLERSIETARAHLPPEAALPWLERLRRERPRDASVAARIAEVHRATGDAEALQRALREEALLAPDPGRRRDLHRERARLLEADLDSKARAIAALEEAHAAAPRDVEVLRQLERLHCDTGNARGRVQALELLIPLTRAPERVSLRREAAAVHAVSLANLPRAIAHWHGALSEGPREGAGRLEILRALCETLRAAGRTDEWARHAEEELRALGADPVFDDRRRALHRELAQTYEERLAQPGAALPHLRALLDRLPESGDAIRPETLEALEARCLRLLRADGSFVELADRLGRRLERRPGDADGWLELAQLRDERLRSPAAARTAYRRALELAPDRVAALRGLRAAAERLGDWAEVARTLELELERDGTLEAAERAALLRRLGDVCWKRLQSTTRASRCYAGALEVSPRDFEALRSLERLLEAMEDWRGALDLYASEAEVLGDDDPARRQWIWLRVGEIARDRLADPARARDAYGRAAELLPLPPARIAERAELFAAQGDTAAFAPCFASWCDHPGSEPTGEDLLRLAEALAELGDEDEARARAERASELAPELAPAWECLARLREAAGLAEAAADALARAAALRGGDAAADALLRAAELVEVAAPARAASLLREAAELAPASAPIQSTLSYVAFEIGDLEEAERAAQLALDLVGPATDEDGPLSRDARLEVALVGGRAARALGHHESAAGLFERALELSPGHGVARGAYAETLADLGDLCGARRALEMRLERGDAYADRARHLALLGRCLEAADEPDAALERFGEALRLDAGLDDALAGAARVLEILDRIEDGIPALERWAAATDDPITRAERLLRAAEWELRVGDRDAAAERHLRAALDGDASRARAWVALVSLLVRHERWAEAAELARDGEAALATETRARAQLAGLRGRAHEALGDLESAADALAAAVHADPDASDAALACARLRRTTGDWRGAASVLESFCARHLEGGSAPAAGAGRDAAGGSAPGLADGPRPDLAEVLEQLGRLRAGPLEDVEGAISVYRRAIELEANRVETRAALAELLSHRPGDAAEALAHHRVVLDADPTYARSLRSLLRIARERGDRAAQGHGIWILRALGQASPAECDAGGADAHPLPVSTRRALDDALGERLRRLANEAGPEIAAALEASDHPTPSSSADPVAGFRAASLVAEAQLTAPALVPLTAPEIGEVLVALVALALESDQVRGDGRLLNALSSPLRRRQRRRLRRALEPGDLEAVGDVDFEAWRSEVRGLAAAAALDETGADLHTALVALVCEHSDLRSEDLDLGGDLSALVAACPEARALLRRAVRAWVETLRTGAA